ncbi:hypothetical protein CRENBAI_012889 [Crenichthys baileyi]|uniref:Uncharacterized protein n=1 Tax=Crenichthys baileyi TaxID=28760 RepID=A0AAV9R4J9_9TELE
MMVTLPQCRYNDDEALLRFHCQKSCLKFFLSQGNWYFQTHLELYDFQVASPCLLIQTNRGTGGFFLSLNVNHYYFTLMNLQYPEVCMLCVCGLGPDKQVCMKLKFSDPLSYPSVILVSCYLACLCGGHCETQSRFCCGGA